MEGIIRKHRLIRFSAALLVVLFVLNGFCGAAAEELRLVPMGNTVGIKMLGDGVLVIGLSKVECGDSTKMPAADAGIKTGDIITYINSEKIESINDFKTVLTGTEDGPITIRVLRQGKQFQFTAHPALSGDKRKEIGVWLRDGIAGIGTVTFLDPESGVFGALGHSINDADTGVRLPMRSGSIMRSSIVSVKKGESGTPGELQGEFDMFSSVGELISNTEHGIFGIMNGHETQMRNEAIPVAKRSELKVGKAYILSNISGEAVEEFEIEISRVYPQGNDGVRDMLVTVTDSRLISMTGGIVQGMSGSPIIQNGKLAGALTHVLVSDPTRGYAIAIENMTKEAYAARHASFVIFMVRVPTNILDEAWRENHLKIAGEDLTAKPFIQDSGFQNVSNC